MAATIVDSTASLSNEGKPNAEHGRADVGPMIVLHGVQIVGFGSGEPFR
jgi:hypothetical protein